METERVAIVKVTEQRLDAALAQLVDLLGNLEAIIPRGSRVLIKPNFVFRLRIGALRIQSLSKPWCASFQRLRRERY